MFKVITHLQVLLMHQIQCQVKKHDKSMHFDDLIFLILKKCTDQEFLKIQKKINKKYQYSMTWVVFETAPSVKTNNCLCLTCAGKGAVVAATIGASSSVPPKFALIELIKLNACAWVCWVYGCAVSKSEAKCVPKRMMLKCDEDGNE